jgi:hypothetical protein
MHLCIATRLYIDAEVEERDGFTCMEIGENI